MGNTKGKSASASKATKAKPAAAKAASKTVAKAKAKTATKAVKAKPVAKKKVVAKAAPVKKPVAKKSANRTAVPKPIVKRVVPKNPPGKKAIVKSAPARKAAAEKKSVAKTSPVAKKTMVAKKSVPQKKATLSTKPVIAKALAAKAAGKPLPPSPVNQPTPAALASSASANRSQSSGVKAVAVQALPKSSVNNTKTRSATKYKPATGNDPAITVEDGRYALPASVVIKLPAGFKPGAKEEYMNPQHLEYFRTKLRSWRAELVEESKQTIENLRDEVRDVGDEAERATRETENSLELRTRDRYRKLISKIDKALKRIEEGHYGYCEETEEEIGLDRLDARPIATLSLDAQERWEHRQKQMGD
ncbi:MAG: RNA polymerase-binding protein DksA [Dokdonella sp.]